MIENTIRRIANHEHVQIETNGRDSLMVYVGTDPNDDSTYMAEATEKVAEALIREFRDDWDVQVVWDARGGVAYVNMGMQGEHLIGDPPCRCGDVCRC